MPLSLPIQTIQFPLQLILDCIKLTVKLTVRDRLWWHTGGRGRQVSETWVMYFVSKNKTKQISKNENHPNKNRDGCESRGCCPVSLGNDLL